MSLKKLAFVALALMLSPFALAGQVNINTADAQMLETVKGLGPTKAQAIVEYRKQHGPFKSVDELVRVPGIKDMTLETIRSHLTVEEATVPAPAEPVAGTTN